MRRRTFLHALGGLGLVACSPGQAPVSRSKNDPSNPNAPEGVMPTVATTTTTTTATATAASSPAPAASDPHAGHAGHTGHTAEGSTDAGSAEVTYVCPMHPEVTSNKPGLCPKCNMKLVPKK